MKNALLGIFAMCEPHGVYPTWYKFVTKPIRFLRLLPVSHNTQFYTKFFFHKQEYILK